MDLNPGGRAEDLISARRTSAKLTAADLDHAEWEKADPVRLTRYWSGEEAPAGRHAEARLLWSEEALNVRFLCHQAEPLVVNATPVVDQKTPGLWERDVCEIFIAPEEGEPERYFEFEAAPTGEWLDLAIHLRPGGREANWHFHSGMTAAGRISEGLVTIAMRLPWAGIGLWPRAGERRRVNLFRCVGRGEGRGYLAWRPTLTVQPNFHVPQRFGWLYFGE